MKTLTLLALVLYCYQIHATPTLEDYGWLPQIQKLVISPNGEMIAYRQVTEDMDVIVVISIA